MKAVTTVLPGVRGNLLVTAVVFWAQSVCTDAVLRTLNSMLPTPSRLAGLHPLDLQEKHDATVFQQTHLVQRPWTKMNLNFNNFVHG